MSVFKESKIIWLLGVPVKYVSTNELPSRLSEILKGQSCHHLVTANPEILLEAYRNPNYHAILCAAEACLADGFGLVVLSRWLQSPILERITGAHITHTLLALAKQNHHSVFILLPKDCLTNPIRLTKFLQSTYPDLDIFVSGDPADARALTADIIFSAQGHPQQELWINRVRGLGARAKIAVGVGGVFDVLTGSIKRAPRWWRALGLEWLWRFLVEPRRRWRRMMRAVIVFPIITLYYEYCRRKNQ